MQELDLRVVFSLLLKKAKLIVLVGLVCALLFGVYSYFFIADTYSSQFEMYISNIRDLETVNAEGISSASLTASQSLVNEYVAVLSNDYVIEEVAKNLKQRGYSMSSRALRNTLQMGSVSETAMLRITCVTTDPKLSQAICQSIAEVAPDKLSEVMQLSSLKIMAAPEEGVKVGPNLGRNVLIGGVLGALVVCAVIVIIYCMDDTVKGERDLKRHMDIVVLGEVPSFDKKARGGKRYGKR